MSVSNYTLSTALEQGSTAISFGGAGFLIFYYIGIIDVLTRLGVIGPSFKVAGVSSGALVATAQCSGLSAAESYNLSLALTRTCRAKSSCMFKLDREIQSILRPQLPSDAWVRCRNTGHLAMTEGTPLGQKKALLVSDFTSQDDLISATAVSAYLPIMSGGRVHTEFRGHAAYDGGWTMPQPCPPDVQYCIKVSTANPTWPKGKRSILAYLGRLVSPFWRKPLSRSSNAAKGRSCPDIISTGPNGTPNLDYIKLAAENNVDIAPGVFNHVPFTNEQWNEMSFTPPDDDTLHDIYKLGKADAIAWARYVGVMNSNEVQWCAASNEAGHDATSGKETCTNHTQDQPANSDSIVKRYHHHIPTIGVSSSITDVR